MPITDGLGLAFAVTRYDGRLVISPTSCRELMPDPEAFALCLRDSFQEYLALAQARSRAKPAAGRRRAPARAAKPAVPVKAVKAAKAVKPVKPVKPVKLVKLVKPARVPRLAKAA